MNHHHTFNNHRVTSSSVPSRILPPQSLLTLYILVEMIVVIVSAFGAVGLFIIFRLLIVFLACQVRYGLMAVSELRCAEPRMALHGTASHVIPVSFQCHPRVIPTCGLYCCGKEQDMQWDGETY